MRICAKVLLGVLGVFRVTVGIHDHHINLYYGFFSVPLANALSDNEVKSKQSTHLLNSLEDYSTYYGLLSTFQI